jgi:hypothetical protein
MKIWLLPHGERCAAKAVDTLAKPVATVEDLQDVGVLVSQLD